MRVPGAHRNQARASDFLVLELKGDYECHVVYAVLAEESWSSARTACTLEL